MKSNNHKEPQGIHSSVQFRALRGLLYFIIACNPIPVFSQQADQIFINGNIITIQSNGSRAEALAIKGNKIIGVGTNKKVLTLKSLITKIIDLKGKTIVPGFNDAHLHPMPIYPFESAHTNLELSPTIVKSMDQLITLLKLKAANISKGWLIQGYGYQDTKLGGHPTRQADPMLRIQSLATRTSAEGIEIGLNQRISAEEAIRLWTIGGAYASFEEKIKGTIEDGKLADFVVLNEDPTKVDIFKLKDIEVLQTIIGGKVAYEKSDGKKLRNNP